MNNNPKHLQQYSIQPGDNIWLLSQKFKVPINDIFTYNPGVDPHRLFIGQVIAIPTKTNARSILSISPKSCKFKSDMRGLWEQHVAWTRMTILSLIFDLPDTNEVVTRLLKNATHMGNAIKPLYGIQAGDMYADLITEHLVLAADLVKAALAGNQQDAMETEKKWYANADKIAGFLASINPFLSLDVVKKMFYMHLDLTKTEAILMMTKDYQKDIDVYDEIERQALTMSDTITEAIIKQFPAAFQ